MRELRLVSRTEDGSLKVETKDGNEQFTLPVDPVLRAAVRGEPQTQTSEAPAEPARPAQDPRQLVPSEPPIGPREIQVRVRSGESPEQLAEAYDMTLDKVLRFAAPVVEERRRIAIEARRSRARRGNGDGRDGSVVSFGETVDERFEAHGVSASSVLWDARRRDDGAWVVVAEWEGDAGTHTAQWVFSRATRSVAPLDETGADLLSDRPIRVMIPAEPQRPSLVAAPTLQPGVVAFPPMPEAHTAPVAVVEEVFDQEAIADDPAPARLEPPVEAFDAPPLPLGIADPVEPVAASSERLTAHRPGADRPRGRGNNRGGGNKNTAKLRDANRREPVVPERNGKPKVPSWDDILLGVRRSSE